MGFCVRDNIDHFKRVIAFMQVRSMSPQDLNRCIRKSAGQLMTAELIGMCIQGAAERRVYKDMISILESRLGRYPTSETEDRERLSKTRNWGEIWSLKYLINRKKILGRLLTKI